MKLNQIALAVAALAAAPAFRPDPRPGGRHHRPPVDFRRLRPHRFGVQGRADPVQGHVVQGRRRASSTQPGRHRCPHVSGKHRPSTARQAAGDRMAYTCTVDTDDDRAGSLEGTKVVVFHTVEGGSFNYVTPALSHRWRNQPQHLPGTLQAHQQHRRPGRRWPVRRGAATKSYGERLRSSSTPSPVTAAAPRPP